MTTRMYRTVQRPPDRLPPSVVHYAEFQAAFEFYREQLFDGELNDCLIVMARNPRTHGYLAPHRWDTGRGGTMHELGMNPLDFATCTTEDVLSTLVHEMCHAWQFDAGEKKPRPKYHNKEWADRMEEIGLIPSHTGEPGGRRTGQAMTHYIDEDGDFLRATVRLVDEGWQVPYMDIPELEAKKKNNRPKYVCPECGNQVWGKSGLKIECLDCDKTFDEEKPEPDSEPAPEPEVGEQLTGAEG